MTGDQLTVLTSVNRKHAGKQFKLHPKTGLISNSSYSAGKYFSAETVEVDGIKSLAGALERIAAAKISFVIRGSLAPGINHQKTRRTLKADTKTGEAAGFVATPRRWLLVDGDDLPCPALIDPREDPEAGVEHMLGLLPRECWDAWCWWQYSAQQSVIPGDDGLRLHLWFWLDRAVDDASLKRWAIAANIAAHGVKVIDSALFNGVQIHYLAAPVFVGMPDPLTRRSGLRQGFDDELSLIIPEANPKHPDQPSGDGFVAGIGVEAYLAQIGGPEGFREPIKSAIASFVAIYGSQADCSELKQAIRAALDRAEPGWRDDSKGKRYAGDQHLDALIDGIRRIHGNRPPKGWTNPPPPHVTEEIPIEQLGDPGPPGDWYSKCMTGVDGRTLSNLTNGLLALREDPVWRGSFIHNELLAAPLLTRTPAGSKGNGKSEYPRPVTDEDVSAIQEWLQLAGIALITKNTTHQAVELVAAENTFHPIRDYLDTLLWDQVERLDDWLTDCFGVAKTEYTMAVGRMFPIGMVARIYEPGCQSDYMLILEGDQGVKKSTACRVLAGEWFSDNMPENIASKDAKLHLRGKWLVEIAELHQFNRAETTALKAFVTCREDIYRPPYGHNEVYRKRQNLFVGTTNKKIYLKDPTGGRRFWPVVTTEIDIETLIKQREQLFAEAVVRYRRREPWWPTPEFEAKYMVPEQEQRFEGDAWQERIAEYLALHTRTTVFRIAHEALGFETQRIGTADQNRIMAVLELLDWQRGKRQAGTGTRWWERV